MGVSMRRFKKFINLDKEEAWLRTMAIEGWELCHRGLFGYRFRKSEEGEHIYRIDYRYFKRTSDYLDYLLLFHDAGWDHVEGSKWSGYQYFVAREGNPDTDIFSDEATRAARYRSIADRWLEVLFLYMILLVIGVSIGGYDFEVYTNPAKLYLTPGLWDMEGARFWFAFLFETPFALLRGAWSFLFPVVVVGSLVMIAVSVVYAVKTWALSKSDSASV